jgi:multidrug efflux pump subunit AcrB
VPTSPVERRPLIERFAKHRVAANLAMLLMILGGVWTLKHIPTQLDPPNVLPYVVVDVEWRGASAEDIEKLVTTPIEQQIRTVDNLRELRSRTINGAVQVLAEFNFGADMMRALDTVKQRVANIRNLPPDIEPPVVRRFVDTQPIASILVTGSGTVGDLIPVVRSMEKDLMARGVAQVQYDGMPDEEIALLTPAARLHELGTTLDDLAADVSRASQDVPAGTVGRGQGSRLLRSLDQKRDPVAFENLLIDHGDRLVRLGDIATVVRRPRDGEPIVTREGRPAIQMTLLRASDFDAARAEDIVANYLTEVRPTLPKGVELTTSWDIWDMLGAQLQMIGNNAATGLLLVIATLIVFLNARVSWWVAAGVPVSCLLGLTLFHWAFGFGVSIIALIGFVMALGIVVDDAIVVGEESVTLFQAGHTPHDAAIRGAQRMFVPVLASSLTTLAAFVPLLLLGGRLGATVLALPTVLFCIIVASLLECFLVLPGHLRASFEKLRDGAQASPLRARFDAAFARFLDGRFMPLARAALDRPGATLCSAIGAMVCGISLVASQHVGIHFVTGFDFESIRADVEFSAAATDAQKHAFIDDLETTLAATDAEYGKRNLNGWTTAQNLAQFNRERQTGVQYVSIEAPFAFEEARTVEPAAFVDAWRKKIHQPAYVEQLYVGVAGGANNGEPDIALVLRGADLDAVKAGAEDLARVLEGYPGVSNVLDDLPYGKDQLIFELTPAGRSLGLTADSLGRQLRAAYSGQRVQIFNENDSELEVRVMLPDAERDDLARLEQFPIQTPSGSLVPLGNVATLYNRRGIDVIRHNNTEMAVRVFADVDETRNNALAIIADVEKNHVAAITAAHHLSFGLSGKSQGDQMILETMKLGSLMALILIYLILAWVFSSYLWPLAIMTAIPFGLTGAVVGHWLTGIDVGAMSMLAFFALSGIVVNDSIVLISFLKEELEAGRSLREALESAVRARFRAVMLTSLTTIAGLLSLMFTSSTLSIYVKPIAVTLCFGLTFSTLLVLLVIPALILLLEGLRHRTDPTIARWRALRERFAATAPPSEESHR